ncbi:hypothetical protein EJ04DRAFT_507531 [Polyplosphaeria fusca]|uniref:Copper acquisition factor BIM1-like domain-containing protein n=1 Tax=Polyplosphaeria fusca TaxID=682080 RepID=A0A9P4V5X0_9PLEO|nr:hypothetical protein EJ04DRAFT_507531 [Polyplosphaeria fusca]
MLSNTLALLSLLPLATAHFVLNWPTARGFEDEKAVNFPCGGFDSVKEPRTEFPLNGGPIQLDFHHTQTNIKVLLALGDDPGNNYNIVLRPTFAEEGPGNFCLGSVSIPSGLNISSGTNGTIQVVSNGDPSGGLYQCADVTFTNQSLSTDEYNANCKNDSVTKVTSENIQGNPNETSSGSPTESNGSQSSGLAAHPTAASWILGAAGLAGLALL